MIACVSFLAKFIYSSALPDIRLGIVAIVKYQLIILLANY
jgi:hypothetical protein